MLLLLLLVLAAGGCECGGPPQETTTVRFWHTFNAEETQTVETLVREFEANHPGVRVEVTVLPFGAARNRLRTALRGATGPDLARAEIAWVLELAGDGLIAPLDDHVDLDAHVPAARPVVEYAGKTWGFPQGVDCLVLYYNKGHLHQINAVPPATLSALVTTGRRLTRDRAGRDRDHPEFDRASVARHALFLKGDGYYFLPFLWGWGGETFEGPAHSVRIASKGSIAAAENFVKLVTEEGIAPARVDFARDYAEELSAFGVGRVSMIVQGPWAAAEILRGEAFSDPANLGVAPVPRGANGQGGSPIGGHGFVVAARSPNQELARELGAYLTREQSQRKLALTNHILPTRVAVYEDAALKSTQLLTDFRAALDQAHGRAIFPGMAQMFDALTPAVQRLLRQESEPEVVLKAVAQEWEAIVAP
jgi:arabinogalactan oligomer / maltooligosaccharide transport system substrate-binding protein